MEEIVIYGSEQPEGLSSKNLSTGSGTGVMDLVITTANVHTGSHIASFKQSSTPRNGISLTESHIIAAQSQKSLLHIYSFLKEGIDQKIVVPERLACIKVSPCGTWLAAGGLTGRLLLWELSSGQLMFARDTHYQEITCIEFTKDSTFLFTASKDSRVLGWQVMDLVSTTGDDFSMGGSDIQPVITWSDHSLPVTSVCVGCGPWNEAYVFTSSLDSTVRCFNILTHELLTTFAFPSKVTSLVVDASERAFYAGLSDGQIIVVPLYDVNPGTGYLEAVGGAQRIITVDPTRPNSNFIVLNQHECEISYLCLSFDGTILLSGDVNGQVYSWDILGKQVMRKLKPHRGSISFIHTVSRPKSEVSAIPSQSKVRGTSGGRAVASYDPIPQLKRVLEPADQQKHEITIRIPSKATPTTLDSVLLEDPEGIEQARMHAAQILDQESSSGLQARVQDQDNQLKDLYTNYCKLQSAHEDLWTLYVKKTLK